MTDLVAEFERASDLAAAIRSCREAGLRALEAFTPWQAHDVQEALRLPRSRIPRWCFAGGLAGGVAGYAIQWWTNAVAWPLDVGGRPLHSAPAWIPATFEGTVMGASLCTAIALLAAARLPRLWQPVFEVEGFERASIDRFFLRVAADQPGFERHHVTELLLRARALRVRDLPELEP